MNGEKILEKYKKLREDLNYRSNENVTEGYLELRERLNILYDKKESSINTNEIRKKHDELTNVFYKLVDKMQTLSKDLDIPLVFPILFTHNLKYQCVLPEVKLIVHKGTWEIEKVYGTEEGLLKSFTNKNSNNFDFSTLPLSYKLRVVKDFSLSIKEVIFDASLSIEEAVASAHYILNLKE